MLVSRVGVVQSDVGGTKVPRVLPACTCQHSKKLPTKAALNVQELSATFQLFHSFQSERLDTISTRRKETSDLLRHLGHLKQEDLRCPTTRENSGMAR
jgi:hypothetical protein